MEEAIPPLGQAQRFPCQKIMKLSVMIGLSVLLLASTAMANNETYMVHSHAHETTQVAVDLPIGKSAVEVWGAGGESISCTFIDRATGNIAYEAHNVKRCLGLANTEDVVHLFVNVINGNDTDLDFKIWVHSTDKRK